MILILLNFISTIKSNQNSKFDKILANSQPYEETTRKSKANNFA